ncbi:MAG: hypothetical protein KA198_01495 [Chitinophagaceae bacterium]|nr:hypothetical protein [Chitinophagaceae bacterium]
MKSLQIKLSSLSNFFPFLILLVFLKLIYKKETVIMPRDNASQSTYAYSIPTPNLPIVENTSNGQTKLFYRIFDQKNICKDMYFNFDDQEKIELLTIYPAFKLGICKVHTYQNQPLIDTYQVVMLRNLQETLPPISS